MRDQVLSATSQSFSHYLEGAFEGVRELAKAVLEVGIQLAEILIGSIVQVNVEVA